MHTLKDRPSSTFFSFFSSIHHTHTHTHTHTERGGRTPGLRDANEAVPGQDLEQPGERVRQGQDEQRREGCKYLSKIVVVVVDVEEEGNIKTCF